MAHWTVNARTLFFDGRPFVHLNKEGNTRPTEADGAARLIVELFNKNGVTPESIFERHMGVKPRGRGARAVAEKDYSMSYGELPTFKQFKHDVSTRIDPEKPNGTPYWPKGMIYPMELVDQREIELAQEFGKLDEFDTSRPGYAYGFKGNEKQIYDFLKFLVRKFNKDGDVDEGSAGGLASSIMYTLGYDWV